MTEDGLQESLLPQETRICPSCQVERLSSDFRAGSPYCRFCFRFANALRLGVPVDRLLSKQGGVCAICREKGDLHIDHIHQKPSERDGYALVRGLLCRRCNWLIGAAEDKPGLLEAAAAYLEKEPQRIYLPVVKAKRRHRSHGPQSGWKRKTPRP